MPTFHVTYSVRVREDVVASDRDHAGLAAIAAGAHDEVLVMDTAGNVYGVETICELCELPIWSDQPRRAHADGHGMVHDECPNAGVLAGGVAERVVECNPEHHVWDDAGPKCRCGQRLLAKAVLAGPCATAGYHVFDGENASCACGLAARLLGFHTYNLSGRGLTPLDPAELERRVAELDAQLLRSKAELVDVEPPTAAEIAALEAEPA